MKIKTAGILVLVALIAIPALAFTFSGMLVNQDTSLPAYATTHPLIKEAYMFAVEHPEALDGVNCYCGCMQHLHDGRIHKRGLLDCFLKENGSFEIHASECDMCIKDALQVKQMFESGTSKETIKQTIDAKYANIGGMHG